MAINVSFNGATIYKPGSYSKVEIDLGGGFPLSPTGIVAILGEADGGKPGDQEANVANVVFSPEQLSEIRNTYISGPIVDAASFVFAPATDAAIPSGAQALYIFKTNSSTQASMALANSYGNIKAQEWGIGGNMITVESTATSEVAPVVTGSVALDDAACLALSAITFNVRLDGGANQVVSVAANSANQAAFLVDLNADLTGVVASFNASDYLVFTVDADANAYQKGYGKTIELSDVGAGADLAVIGHSAAVTNSSVEYANTIVIKQTRDLIEESDIIGGNPVIKINYVEAAATAATVTVDATKIDLIVTGGANAGTISLLKAQYPTIKNLVDAINLQSGWTAALEDSLYAQLSVDWLDYVTTLGALSSNAANFVCRIKKDYGEVVDFFGSSSLIFHEELSVAPNQIGCIGTIAEAALSGGVKGATAPADISAALEAFTKFRVNCIVPLFSRDATADIADSLTDSGSAYTIEGIHQAVKTHLSLMATTKRKSERQGYLGFKKSWDEVKSQVGNIATERAQLVCQDMRQINAYGIIKWFQPHMLAAMVAGARCGSPIGTPLTFKYMNISGLRHTAQAMSTPEQDIVTDFDPDLQYDEAIQAGVTFLEAPQSGGYRIVVDNTTYNKDGNWVKNRGNVQYAADVLAYDFRNQLENIYVGSKNTISAAEVKGTCESILATYLAQGITVGTPSAPNGFKSLVARIEGNTIYVNVVVVLVEGIDFVLAEITLSRAQSEA